MRRLGLALLVAAVAGGWILGASGGVELEWWRRYTPAVFALNVAGALLALGALVVWGPATGAGVRAKKLLAVGVSIVLALVVVELPAVVLGHDYREALGTLTPEERLGVPLRANRIDPELIHVHHPSSGFRGRVRGNLAPIGGLGEGIGWLHDVDVRYDSKGFRNDRELERAGIVVVGDSFVEAALVRRSDTLPARLEAATGLVAANLGQAAYGPQQELVVLRRLGLPLEPRVVVWCFFGGNDLRDVDAYRELRDVSDRLEELARTPVADRLFTTSVVQRLRAHGKRAELARGVERRSAWLPTGAGERSRVIFGRVEGPWKDDTLVEAQGVLREAAALTREVGAGFLVVYIPRKFRVYDGLVEHFPGSVAARWESNDLPQVLGAWCSDEGIAFVDTTAVLRSRAEEGEAPYFADDVHWNAVGHEVATELVLERVRAEGWITEVGE